VCQSESDEIIISLVKSMNSHEDHKMSSSERNNNNCESPEGESSSSSTVIIEHCQISSSEARFDSQTVSLLLDIVVTQISWSIVCQKLSS